MEIRLINRLISRAAMLSALILLAGSIGCASSAGTPAPALSGLPYQANYPPGYTPANYPPGYTPANYPPANYPPGFSPANPGRPVNSAYGQWSQPAFQQTGTC